MPISMKEKAQLRSLWKRYSYGDDTVEDIVIAARSAYPRILRGDRLVHGEQQINRDSG